MAIIIGDIHGDLAMANAFLAYRPNVEHVALGDLVDSRDPHTTLEEELACLDLLLASDTMLIWGNHDLAYLPEGPWECFTRFKTLDASRYGARSEFLTERQALQGNLRAQDLFEERYQLARHRFKAAHAVDGWLCTHAGLSTALAATLPDLPLDSGDSHYIAEWLNQEYARELTAASTGPLFQIGLMRGGTSKYGGIFWYDPRWEPAYPPDPRVRQIFAHTQVEGPLKKGTWINVHIEGGWWVYDTELDDFVVLR